MKKIIAVILTCLITVNAYGISPSALSTDSAFCSSGTVPVKYEVVDDASSGDNTIIAAVSGKKIVVLSYTLVAADAVLVRFESGAGGTALTGQMSLAANGGISANCAPYGCFSTAASGLLNLELGGAVSVDGHITYIVCD